MPSDTTSLSELLRQKAPRLHIRYTALSDEAARGFQTYASGVGYLTEHGQQHCTNVVANLDALLPLEVKDSLSVEEVFLLLCSAHFHDIGVLYEKQVDEPWQEARRDHADRSYDYIHEFHEHWGLNRFEAYALKNICLGHGGALHELPEDIFIHQYRVRIRLLSALLSLADALDADYTRVSKYIQQLRKIPEDSLRHWIKHEDISGVHIDPKSWTIEIHAMPRNEDVKEILKELAESKIQRDLDWVRPVLEKHGLHYRRVDVKYIDFGKKRMM